MHSFNIIMYYFTGVMSAVLVQFMQVLNGDSLRQCDI